MGNSGTYYGFTGHDEVDQGSLGLNKVGKKKGVLVKEGIG